MFYPWRLVASQRRSNVTSVGCLWTGEMTRENRYMETLSFHTSTRRIKTSSPDLTFHRGWSGLGHLPLKMVLITEINIHSTREWLIPVAHHTIGPAAASGRPGPYLSMAPICLNNRRWVKSKAGPRLGQLLHQSVLICVKLFVHNIRIRPRLELDMLQLLYVMSDASSLGLSSGAD